MSSISRGKALVLLSLSHQSVNEEQVAQNVNVSVLESCPLTRTIEPELESPSIDENNLPLDEDIFHNSDDEDKDPDYVPPAPTSDLPSLEVSVLRPVNLEPSNNVIVSTRKRSNRTVYTVPSKRSRLIRNSRKIKRNTGQAYVTESGKEIRARFCHDLTPCRNKCYIKFDTIKRKELFDAFWSMQSYDRRADYINSLMMAKPKATTRKRTEANNRNRDFTFYYYFKIDGELHKTCKVCFTKTFDITEGFLKVQHSKILLNSSSIRNTDQRGQHSPPNKTNIDRKNEIISHINSFPKYESHYSRRHTEKKYLPPNLTISKMYSLYKETNANPVSYNIYRTIFKEMKIGFKVPYNDTCQTCDTFKIRFKIAQEEEKPTLEREWNIHKEKADFHYEMKAKDKTESKQNHSLKLISFDLQQVLQTPYLLTSVMFYKRQLAVYNLTVHEGDTGIAYNYLWNETIAGRGANQIGSCLNKYIQVQLSPEVEHLIMYSDTCTGQNRNSHVAAMCFSALKQSPTLKCIDHKFMISGHSHMECDTAHAAIEKKKKTTAMDIHHPRDWIQLIRSMGQKYFAIEMLQEEFYDYKNLYSKDLQLKTKDDENNKFVWHDVQWMRFLKEESCIMLFKHSLDPTEPFKRISFKRRGKKTIDLKPKKQYNKLLPISKEKKADLISIIHLINPVFHEYYKSLPDTENITHETDSE